MATGPEPLDPFWEARLPLTSEVEPRASRPSSSIFPSRAAMGALRTVVLWGSPMHRHYRATFRELQIAAFQAPIIIRHRHHGFDDDHGNALMAAELIEAATDLHARDEALNWLVAHGEDGMLPIAELAVELKVDGASFTRAFFDDSITARVHRDREEARRHGWAHPVVLTLGRAVFADRRTIEWAMECLARREWPDAPQAAAPRR